MQKIRMSGVLATIGVLSVAGAVIAGPMFHEAKPGEYDPVKGFLVQAAWLSGLGCPTDATTTPDGSTKTTYTDPACPTGDSKDRQNEGVVLAKTGPTSNYAEPYLTLKNLKNVSITELGYDIRKPASWSDPRGSQCSSDGPTFQLVKGNDVYYIACASPPPDGQTAGNGWVRLRWGGSAGTLMAYKNGSALTNISGMTFDAAYIVLQAGQDEGPEDFGLAVLDNIDVNGTLVGRGEGGGD